MLLANPPEAVIEPTGARVAVLTRLSDPEDVRIAVIAFCPVAEWEPDAETEPEQAFRADWKAEPAGVVEPDSDCEIARLREPVPISEPEGERVADLMLLIVEEAVVAPESVWENLRMLLNDPEEVRLPARALDANLEQEPELVTEPA
jgi:hypothetical protein